MGISPLHPLHPSEGDSHQRFWRSIERYPYISQMICIYDGFSPPISNGNVLFWMPSLHLFLSFRVQTSGGRFTTPHGAWTRFRAHSTNVVAWAIASSMKSQLCRVWDGLHVSPRTAPSKRAQLSTYFAWFLRPI